MSSGRDAEYKWLHTGEEALEQMLAAIAGATQSVRLEMYIFHAGPTANQFRDALVNACKRGLRVRVLVDALGSAYLPDSFWEPFRASGGEFRWFNPLSLHHVFIRDHRKMLVCDDGLAFIGGFNIATEYRGNGVTAGWRDLGLRMRSPLARDLAVAFDDMFACADFKHRPFTRLRKSFLLKTVSALEAKLLLGGPGRNNPLKRALLDDMKEAREVLIISPYFVPPWKIRRLLMRLARHGAKVRLILPAKCDLPVMRMAAQSFYRRFMAAGVEIHEYQPQILHAKLYVVDQIVYAGSANLDGRSLNINYELMVRLASPALVAEGREIFAGILAHCRRIQMTDWRRSRTFLDRMKARVAHIIMARIDPLIARHQLRWWKTSLSKINLARRHKTSNLNP
ncbi:MAG: phosphatidylserine/phosphatidylglycerophosphate/cardiolipin synthase family protein [Verrucomicrobiota bacterium]